MIPANVDKLPGGIADNMSPQDFDPEQLAMGIKIEREHTDDVAIAMEIVMDHLAEIPDYYTRLKVMEDEAKMKNESLIMTAGQLRTMLKEAIEFGDAEQGFLTDEMPEEQVNDMAKRLGLTRSSSIFDDGDPSEEIFWLSGEDFEKVDDELKKHRGSGHSDEDAWQDYKFDLQDRVRQKVWDREDAELATSQEQNYAKAEDALTRLLDRAETSGREYAGDNPGRSNDIDARDLVDSMKYDPDFDIVMKHGDFDSADYLMGALADSAAGGLEG
jgi:hypothetical protein